MVRRPYPVEFIATSYSLRMTCDSSLVSNPAVIFDPTGEGKILYWSCCDRQWYLSPADDAPHRTYWAWHEAATALSR